MADDNEDYSERVTCRLQSYGLAACRWSTLEYQQHICALLPSLITIRTSDASPWLVPLCL